MKHIIDDVDKNKFEAFTKAEVLALIQQVIEEGQLPQDLLNALVISIKNPIDNQGYKIAFCTQAKYNELQSAGTLENDCWYIITDDTTSDDIDAVITNLNTAVEDLQDTTGTLTRQVTTNTTDITNLKNARHTGSFSFSNGLSANDEITFSYFTNVNVYADNGSQRIKVLYEIDYSLVTPSVKFYKPNGEELTGTWTIYYEYFSEV